MAEQRLDGPSFTYVLTVTVNAVVAAFVAVLAAAIASGSAAVTVATAVVVVAGLATGLLLRLRRAAIALDGDQLTATSLMRTAHVSARDVEGVEFRDVWFTPSNMADVPTVMLTSGRRVKLTLALGSDTAEQLAQRVGEWAGGVPVGEVSGRGTRRSLRRATRERGFPKGY